MPNWNVPDNLTPDQAQQQRPATPYAAVRAKNPLPAQAQMPQVAAPQNQMPGVPGMTAPNMQRPAAQPMPQTVQGAQQVPQMPKAPRAPQTAIGYGTPGNPQRPQKGY